MRRCRFAARLIFTFRNQVFRNHFAELNGQT